MLEFDKKKHEYKINGFKVPSVTQVLDRSGLVDLSMIPEDCMEKARQRGTAIHLATELYDKDDLDHETLSEAWRPYLDAWKSFLKDYKVEIKEIEKRVYSLKYMFAGTLDRVGTAIIKGVRMNCIIDIKHGQYQKTYAIQTAGYEISYKELTKRGREKFIRLCVFLQNDGNYKIIESQGKNDINVFLSALIIANYKGEK